MTKPLLTALLLFFTTTLTVAAQDAGLEPKSGNTYYIYNVGQGQYLSRSGSQLTLSSSQTAIILGDSQDTTTSATCFLTLSASAKFGASLWLQPTADGTADYTDWQPKLVEGTTATYTLGNRQTETNALQHLYYSQAQGRLSTVAQQPGADFKDGQWLFLSTTYTGIESAETQAQVQQQARVCSISGQVLRTGTTSLDGLAHGIYIVGGRKVAK